jgi:subtilase family serine protease
MKVLARLLCAGVFCCALNLVAQPQDTDAVKAPTEILAQSASQQPAAPQPQIYKRPGKIVIPDSSIERAEDVGRRMHTNVEIFVPEGRPMASIIPDDTFTETPASLGCVYRVGPIYNNGCTPAAGGTNHPTGGWGAIALVDAYDNPEAAHDLATFSSHYGLPAAQFRKIYANTSYGSLHGWTASCSGTPAGNTGWGLEEDLDIEYAHAMAPSAKILLVEACSNSGADLYFAELVAGIEVTNRGGGDISNSWGGGEWSGEVGAGADDVFFRYYPTKIVYFASAGDYGWGAQYPSSSPWVVSAGGTTINRDSSQNFVSESCWSGSGGGVSSYETWQSPPDIHNGMGPWSAFQYPFAGQTARQTPDISFDADPNSGASVYDSYGYGGWMTIGGTSLASPALAGIVNASKNLLGEASTAAPDFTTAENNMIYSQLNSHLAYLNNFYDVTTGSNGVAAGPGYDQCTGVGSVRGHLGK